jgi:hypothetical protein
MSPFFAFESELERSLQFIPMAVRLKLDRCGVKLSLSEWSRFPEGNRRNLLQAPCNDPAEVARYRQALCRLIQDAVGGEPQLIPVAEHQPWDDADVPGQVANKTAEMGINPPTSAQWHRLTTLQRFALVKLTRDANDHRNFVPALREFGLI